MQYSCLGGTLEVSRLCLGTMVFGEQVDQNQAFHLMDRAVEGGINFFDVAEMYAIPPKAATYGASERILGAWLKARGNRDQMIIASKVAGPSSGMKYIRKGKNKLDRKNIEQAIDGSLQRLQTDYLDLYQLHWPDRQTNYFGKLGYEHPDSDDSVPMEETLSVLNDLVNAGKVRCIGVSNETPWGVMQFLHLAAKLQMPRMVSIQNPYNLLNRSFEVGLAEIAHREDVPLLAYSPLGFGTLTGKYLGKTQPKNARLSLFKGYNRYTNPQGVAATREYANLAKESRLSMAQMALAFVTSRSFLASNIIGATTMEQLEENLHSIDITLSEDVIEAIEAIHKRFSNPCP